MEIVEIRSVGELIAACLATKNPQVLKWYRGHAEADWELVPSAHRSLDYAKERGMMTRFRLATQTRHPNCPGDRDLARWISLAQHYRLRTRLLDWSESPLTALFFAVSWEPKGGAAAVWQLAPGELNGHTVGSGISFIEHPKISPLLTPVFTDTDQLDEVVAVSGPEVDIRMSLQQSSFTLHGDGAPLEKHPKASEFLRKFVIAEADKESFMGELRILGVRRSSLFHDLENLAVELAEWDYQFGDSEEPSGST